MDSDTGEEIKLPSEETEEVKEEAQNEEPTLNSEDQTQEVELPSETGEEQQQEEQAEEKPEEKKEEEKKEETPDDGDWTQKYKNEFMEKGEISEDSIKEIVDKHKLPESVVREYIELSKAQAETARAKAEEEVLGIVGGRESFTEMVNWAKDNLTKEEIATFDKQVSKDVDSAKMAVTWLKSKFVDAGNASTLIEGKATTLKLGYKSKEDYHKDIGDPRYLHDTAYRNKVNKKLEQSDLRLLK